MAPKKRPVRISGLFGAPVWHSSGVEFDDSALIARCRARARPHRRCLSRIGCSRGAEARRARFLMLRRTCGSTAQILWNSIIGVDNVESG